MKRMTFEGNFCEICGCEGEYRMTSECEDGACSQRKVWERLKEYEDTGLEPEEIDRILDAYGRGMTLRQENGERLRLIRGISTDRLRELVQADMDGRLVIIPEPSAGLECDLLEPMKVGYALKTEVVKLNMRLSRDPKSVNRLDYTIIAALQAVLEGGGSDG